MRGPLSDREIEELWTVERSSEALPPELQERVARDIRPNVSFWVAVATATTTDTVIRHIAACRDPVLKRMLSTSPNAPLDVMASIDIHEHSDLSIERYLVRSGLEAGSELHGAVEARRLESVPLGTIVDEERNRLRDNP